MTEITDLKIVAICGFSKVFIKVNGLEFESSPIMGDLDEELIRERLGIDL